MWCVFPAVSSIWRPPKWLTPAPEEAVTSLLSQGEEGAREQQGIGDLFGFWCRWTELVGSQLHEIQQQQQQQQQ